MSYKIAITGTGGGVGQSIMKSFYNTDYQIIALDSELLGSGLYAAPKSYLIPYANKPDYMASLLEICKKENISLLFPGLDAELAPLSKNRKTFEEVGTRIVVSAPDVIELSDDKQCMFDRLKGIGIDLPDTYPLKNLSTIPARFPVIIKQRIGGARSKNVFFAGNANEWDSIITRIGNKTEDFIVQEYIDGEEYTCGTVNLDNSCKGIIVMRRTLRDGDTYKCFTVRNAIIEDTVRKVVEAIKPFGACNIQLRMKDGRPYIFEINARCSGTTAARTLCGFNEPKMIADFLIKGNEPIFEIKEKTVLRYWKELVVENEEVEFIKQHKYLNSTRRNFL